MNLRTRLRDVYRQVVFNLSARNSYLYIAPYRYFYRPKAGTIADFYHRLSKGMFPIRVIQVGANDGITHDPIHKFIKRDGWTGLLIEPQPKVFREKLFPLYRRNTQIHLENVAISEQVGLMDFYTIAFSSERWATGLSSFSKQTIEEKIDQGIIDEVARHNGVKPPKNKEDYLKVLKVESKTATFLMDKYQLHDYDVLQVDAEGYDFEIVQLFNIEAYPPKVIVYEEKHLSDEQIQEVRKYLNDRKYRSVRLRGDRLAVHRDFDLGNRIVNKMNLVLE